MLVKVLREDELVAAISNFVGDNLGSSFREVQPWHLESVYRCASHAHSHRLMRRFMMLCQTSLYERVQGHGCEDAGFVHTFSGS
jgi:hypothetical protein